jgi:hypothetical protein
MSYKCDIIKLNYGALVHMMQRATKARILDTETRKHGSLLVMQINTGQTWDSIEADGPGMMTSRISCIAGLVLNPKKIPGSSKNIELDLGHRLQRSTDVDLKQGTAISEREPRAITTGTVVFRRGQVPAALNRLKERLEQSPASPVGPNPVITFVGRNCVAEFMAGTYSEQAAFGENYYTTLSYKEQLHRNARDTLAGIGVSEHVLNPEIFGNPDIEDPAVVIDLRPIELTV